MSAPWWADGGPTPDDELRLDGASLSELARAHGTPLYVVSRRLALAQVERLREALPGARIHYAMKANRCRALLDALRPACLADACSPREVALALEVGWPREDISFTAGNLSDRDLDALIAMGVHVNLDARSAIRRYAARGGRGPIGLRVDPGVVVGYGHDPKVTYGNTKFGFLAEDVPEAAALAASLDLEVDTLHCHAGWGLQEPDAARMDEAFARLASLARALPTVRVVNVGGGLGARQRAEDAPLALGTWAASVRRHLGAWQVACEPGTWVVARAGVLLAEVVQVERKGDVTWVGLDAGHNVNVYAAHYGIPMEIVPVARPNAACDTTVHVAGNLNEAGDVFARDRRLPALAEGELVALLPAGAYGATMASDHCLRGGVSEIAV